MLPALTPEGGPSPEGFAKRDSVEFSQLISDIPFFSSSQATRKSTSSVKLTLGNFRRVPSGFLWDAYARRKPNAAAVEPDNMISALYSKKSRRGFPIILFAEVCWVEVRFVGERRWVK